MSEMKYDAMVQKGKRLMITSSDRDYSVTGPYIVLESFSVCERFAEFLDDYDSPYKECLDQSGAPVQLTDIIGYHHIEFTQWLVDNLYLEVEPKYILRLGYRMHMEYTENDSI